MNVTEFLRNPEYKQQVAECIRPEEDLKITTKIVSTQEYHYPLWIELWRLWGVYGQYIDYLARHYVCRHITGTQFEDRRAAQMILASNRSQQTCEESYNQVCNTNKSTWDLRRELFDVSLLHGVWFGHSTDLNHVGTNQFLLEEDMYNDLTRWLRDNVPLDNSTTVITCNPSFPSCGRIKGDGDLLVGNETLIDFKVSKNNTGTLPEHFYQLVLYVTIHWIHTKIHVPNLVIYNPLRNIEYRCQVSLQTIIAVANMLLS
jgi:hypothetical protein